MQFQIGNIRQIAETLLGAVDWKDAAHGFCSCPGQTRHTKPNKRTDCTVFITGVPSINCFHTSCRADIETANREFRRAVARGAGQIPDGPRRKPVKGPLEREREALDRLRHRAQNSRGKVLREFATGPEDLFEQSPARLLEGPENDWRVLLQLFTPGDFVWIGDFRESGPGYGRNFRPASEWVALPRPPARSHAPARSSRGLTPESKENVASTPYLVVESDSLTKPEVCAVFSWLRQFLQLRAIVDTGAGVCTAGLSTPAPRSWPN